MEIQRIGLAVVPAEAARSSETSGAEREALMRGGDGGPPLPDGCHCLDRQPGLKAGCDERFPRGFRLVVFRDRNNALP